MNMQFNLRQQVEAEIERLLVILDAMDGNADLEGDNADDEPSLGFLEADKHEDRAQTSITVGTDDDREVDCEDEGAQCDDEGDISDSGIGDTDGLMEQVVSFNGQLLAGYGSSGFARLVE